MPSGISIHTDALNEQGDVLARRAAGGSLDVMGGKKPKSAMVAIDTQPMLARMPFTGFIKTEDGIMRAMLRQTMALLGGDATWFRITAADGKSAVWDGTVGEEGSDADMIMRTTKISKGVLVGPVSFEHDMRGHAQ